MATSVDERPVALDASAPASAGAPDSLGADGPVTVAMAPAESEDPGEPTVRLEAASRRRERFWNLPNSITMLRTGAVPVILMLPLFPDEASSAVIAWIFIVAAVTDILDGWLARRGAQVTSIGKLLDPLADKLLVSTALIVLLAMGRIPIWATWMVVVVVGRELAVTGLRGIASAGGQVVAANSFGKLKAVTQNIAIGALLFHYQTLGLDANTVGMWMLFIATALTLASGYLYFRNYFVVEDVAKDDGS